MTVTSGPGTPLVVVGSGIVGASAAYHLLRLGAEDVTVLEAGEPSAGSTPAGAGFVALWAAGALPLGPGGLLLEQYALEFYRELQTAGTDIGYRSNGNLVLALTEAGFADRPARLLAHPAASIGTRSLSGAEVAALTGVVDAGAVHGATFMPSGIQVEAERAVAAVLERVRGMGGKVVTNTPVLGLEGEDGRLRRVRTGAGGLDVGGVVLAAGGWTNALLDHLGGWLPLLPVVATRLVTDDVGVPETMPTVQCPELKLWIRGRDGAFTWGTAAGYEPLYRFRELEGDVVPGRPSSPRLVERLLADQPAVAEVFPPLAGARVAQVLQGIAVYTPDRCLVTDLVPGWSNAVVLAGDNESGVTHGPAMGRVGAELLLGVPPFADVSAFRADRFDAGAYPDEAAVDAHLSLLDAPGDEAAGSLGFLARN